MTMTLPAGTYTIADPIELGREQYEAWLGQFLAVNHAKVLTEGSNALLVIADFGGDGTYSATVTDERSARVEIPVDTGMVALMPSRMVKGKGRASITFKRPAAVTLTKFGHMTGTVRVSDGHSQFFIDFA
jgi:hypothetical protein